MFDRPRTSRLTFLVRNQNPAHERKRKSTTDTVQADLERAPQEGNRSCHLESGRRAPFRSIRHRARRATRAPAGSRRSADSDRSAQRGSAADRSGSHHPASHRSCSDGRSRSDHPPRGCRRTDQARCGPQPSRRFPRSSEGHCPASSADPAARHFVPQRLASRHPPDG